MKILSVIIILVIVSACAGPKFLGYTINNLEALKTTKIDIIKDDKTREGFLKTIEDWLDKNNYKYNIRKQGSLYDLDNITLEYSGYWRWDIVLYMYKANITAMNKGQKIGKVEFNAPNSLNNNKWGKAETRIRYMMDVLFGKMTLEEANKKLN